MIWHCCVWSRSTTGTTFPSAWGMVLLGFLLTQNSACRGNPGTNGQKSKYALNLDLMHCFKGIQRQIESWPGSFLRCHIFPLAEKVNAWTSSFWGGIIFFTMDKKSYAFLNCVIYCLIIYCSNLTELTFVWTKSIDLNGQCHCEKALFQIWFLPLNSGITIVQVEAKKPKYL